MAIINGFFMGFYWDDKNGMIVMGFEDFSWDFSWGFNGIQDLSIDLGNLLLNKRFHYGMGWYPSVQ